MKDIYGVLVCIIFLLFDPSNTKAQPDSAGFVETVSGDVFITSSQTTVKAVTNMQITQG